MNIAFVEGRVFIGNGEVLENGTVMVEGNRILKVTEGNIRTPHDFRIIPLAGRTLLPGFIDCHVHLCLDGSPDPIGVFNSESLPMSTLKAVEFAKKTVMAGITTVRDAASVGGIDLALRDAVRSGLISGPRILASRLSIAMTGGHGWNMDCREADGPYEVMKAVREQIKGGADVLKFMATGGVMTPGEEPGSEQLTEEELRAGIYEAHKARKKTLAHAQGTQGILNALRAGIDSIEHGVFLNEEAISLMLNKDVPLVPTLTALYNIQSKGLAAGIPTFAVDKTVKVWPSHQKSVVMAREAGVRVAMGTDAGSCSNFHGNNLEELRHLLEVGYSPMDALQSGTQIGAKVLGLENELGTIEEGKLADMIVVEGNPLQDIGILLDSETITFVMQDGKLVKGEA